jgi:hypothetical protein
MGGWIQLWYIVRTFAKVTKYPQQNNKNKQTTNKQWFGTNFIPSQKVTQNEPKAWVANAKLLTIFIVLFSIYYIIIL